MAAAPEAERTSCGGAAGWGRLGPAPRLACGLSAAVGACARPRGPSPHT